AVDPAVEPEAGAVRTHATLEPHRAGKLREHEMIANLANRARERGVAIAALRDRARVHADQAALRRLGAIGQWRRAMRRAIAPARDDRRAEKQNGRPPHGASLPRECFASLLDVERDVRRAALVIV